VKGTIVALDTIEGRKAAALIVDGVLQDFLCDPPADAPPMPGAILAARGGRPAKGTGGTFVDLGGPRGFLRGGGGVPGRMLAVQVSGVAEPGKAVPVTAAPVHKGRHIVLTPGRPGVNVSRAIRGHAERARLQQAGEAALGGRVAGLILRSAAEGLPAEALAGEIAALAAEAEAVAAGLAGAVPGTVLLAAADAHARAARDWPAVDTDAAPGAFARHGVDAALGAARDPVWKLPGGAWMAVEPTRALVAVDVNTGGDFTPAAGLKALLSAMSDLPRALRIKGLGGQIVIDPARLAKADRRRAEVAAKRAFRDDPVQTAVVGWTPLGHLELNRQRDRWPLATQGG
jgi:ribonuclease G